MPNAERIVRAWPWAGGVILGLLVLGPGLGPGSLLSLDLSLTSRIPMPPGVWGLGPALPQRVPSFVPIALASSVVGGPTAAKICLVAAVALAFVGVTRLLGEAPALARAGAGLLYAAGPFLLTRIAAGHLNVVLLAAVLPWVVTTLTRPSEDLGRTFLAVLALAAAGSAAGSVAGVLVVAGLVAERRGARVVRVGAVATAANLVWLVPDLVVLWAGAQVRGGTAFRTQVPTLASAGAVLTGGGFWRADLQVGGRGVAVAVGGLALAGLAAAGHRDLPARWRGPALGAAVGGLVLTFASALPGLRTVYGRFTDLPFGAPFRESQRALLLWLVWAAPAAALGAVRLGRAVAAGRRDRGGLRSATSRVVVAVPLVLGLALAGPGLWGDGGRLQPVRFPSGWAAARHLIRASPGPAVAFPWHEYISLSFVRNRTVLNPLPDQLGGDVVSSYDPEFDGRRAQEQVDHRARVIDGLVDPLIAGAAQSSRLQALGIRWVVLLHEADWTRYSAALSADPGLELAADAGEVEVYRVRGWTGPAVAPGGRGIALRRPIPPLIRTSAPAGSVLDVAGAPGWVRGWGRPVPITADGRLRVPSGSGPLWFWPSLLVLAVDLGLAGGAVWSLAHRRRGRVPPVAIERDGEGSANGFLRPIEDLRYRCGQQRSKERETAGWRGKR